MAVTDVITHFKNQSRVIEALGSPFTARLFDRFVDDLEDGGVVRSLLADWTHPRSTAPGLRLTGALHAAALSRKDPKLAELYPGNGSSWSMDDVWPAAKAFLARETDWVSSFLSEAPQTNETRRAILFAAGAMMAADQFPGMPIDWLEIGASAGLNLSWDQFNFQTPTWNRRGESNVFIDTPWRAAIPPLDVGLRVQRRMGCDRNPLNIRSEADRLRLKSYIWPDQQDRLDRFDAATALALSNGIQVVRADAAEWLVEQLVKRSVDRMTIVCHSVFFQYPPPKTRMAIKDAIETAGRAATTDAPVVWLRVEPAALFGGDPKSNDFLADMVIWPNGERIEIAKTDGHATQVWAASA